MHEINEFLKAIDNFEYVSYFRGHSDLTWELVPSIARMNPASLNIPEHAHWSGLECDILREFEKHGCSIFKKAPQNELEWLIHAQHHGLPTRLLDWSTNPLKALFFAVEDPSYDHLDGVVYGVEPKLNFVMEKFVELNKFDMIIGFHSSSLNHRVTAQEGSFTLSPLPNKWEPFTEIQPDNKSVDYLASYIIPKEHKSKLRKQLKKLGITHKFMFPDLDGLAKSIKRNYGL
ncbi:FRG domain-containing protein [Psychromonas sp. KJ10-10]|uniref:FRG domain-containing protein n=1 Tax=Psychromonas sp. KJ10-10 TaxID=3391823 RepID=UPI0039B62594